MLTEKILYECTVQCVNSYPAEWFVYYINGSSTWIWYLHYYISRQSSENVLNLRIGQYFPNTLYVCLFICIYVYVQIPKLYPQMHGQKMYRMFSVLCHLSLSQALGYYCSFRKCQPLEAEKTSDFLQRYIDEEGWVAVCRENHPE